MPLIYNMFAPTKTLRLSSGCISDLVLHSVTGVCVVTERVHHVAKLCNLILQIVFHVFLSLSFQENEITRTMHCAFGVGLRLVTRNTTNL